LWWWWWDQWWWDRVAGVEESTVALTNPLLCEGRDVARPRLSSCRMNTRVCIAQIILKDRDDMRLGGCGRNHTACQHNRKAQQWQHDGVFFFWLSFLPRILENSLMRALETFTLSGDCQGNLCFFGHTNPSPPCPGQHDAAIVGREEGTR
jgi:hypothetical protein